MSIEIKENSGMMDFTWNAVAILIPFAVFASAYFIEMVASADSGGAQILYIGIQLAIITAALVLLSVVDLGEWPAKFVGDIFFIMACICGLPAILFGLASFGVDNLYPVAISCGVMTIPHFAYKHMID